VSRRKGKRLADSLSPHSCYASGFVNMSMQGQQGLFGFYETPNCNASHVNIKLYMINFLPVQ
jgi:hypothetical protein